MGPLHRRLFGHVRPTGACSDRTSLTRPTGQFKDTRRVSRYWGSDRVGETVSTRYQSMKSMRWIITADLGFATLGQAVPHGHRANRTPVPAQGASLPQTGRGAWLLDRASTEPCAWQRAGSCRRWGHSVRDRLDVGRALRRPPRSQRDGLALRHLPSAVVRRGQDRSERAAGPVRRLRARTSGRSRCSPVKVRRLPLGLYFPDWRTNGIGADLRRWAPHLRWSE